MDTVHDGHAESAPYMWPAARSYSQYLGMEVVSILTAIMKSSAVSELLLQTSWSACLDEQITFGRKSGGIFMKVRLG